MNVLQLQIVTPNGPRVCAFAVRRVVNAGYVSRDSATIQTHIEELRKQGVPAPSEVPMVFPVMSRNITTDEEIEVIGDRTSGEAEFVLLLEDHEMYVGVGSDHTDREVETFSIVRSKQICCNVVSRQVWRYQDVEPAWDDLVLRSWVKPTQTSAPLLYQEGPLGSIISPVELVDLVRSKLTGESLEGLVIFSGTIPLLAGETICGSEFRAELFDPSTHKSLTCFYRVRQLDFIGSLDSR